MPDIKLRNATESDFSSIYQMICELENEKLDESAFKDIFQENLANKNIYYIVATQNEKVIGFVSLYIQSLLHHAGKAAEIQELFVNPTIRGKGIGKLLIDYVRAIAKKENCKVFEVSCNLKREKTHEFYEKVGLDKTHYKFTTQSLNT